MDYALFIDGRCVGVIEAKRQFKDVPGRIGQAKRYAIGIDLTPDELPRGGPWTDGDDRFRVPFLFVTNGRPYVKQLATKSGTWFWDARSGSVPRALVEWFSPRDLTEKLEQQLDKDLDRAAEKEIGVTGLRPYQKDAIEAVRDAVGRGQDYILLAMATGTGKTRLAIALMYDLLRAKRFRRILFLVDRNALGRQTLDAMSSTDTNGFLKFDEVFPVADLAAKFPQATDRVQVATVQAMVRRVFDDPHAERPTPGTYDLIIVDEAHRGYTLDAELREDDLGFRNLEDYLSAYRRVLDYFDATKVALTATPALHTREIFGPPVFRYGYRQAVIDGYGQAKLPQKRENFTAYGQACVEMARGAFDLLIAHEAKLFVSLIPNGIQPPADNAYPDYLRKDQVFLFERFYYFLEAERQNGLIVMDETEKTQDRRFVSRLEAYFHKTATGRNRSYWIVPSPLFVASDMNYAVQAADICLYCTNWGFRLDQWGEQTTRDDIAVEFGPKLSRLQWHGEGMRDGNVFRTHGIVMVPDPYEGR